MSGQEMFPQEHSSSQSQRQYNSDPREQGYGATYQSGYRPSEPYPWPEQGEKLRPGGMSSANRNWQIALLVIAALIIGASLGGVFGSILNALFSVLLLLVGLVLAAIAIARWGFNRSIPLPPQSFSVSAPPELVIDNIFGSVRIHAGASDRVEVQAIKQVSSMFGQGEEISVDYDQRGNTIDVRARYSTRTSMGNVGRVDLDIAAPAQSSLRIKGNATVFHVSGISGEMDLRTNAGTIDVEQARLEGHSRLITNAGTIRFVGALDPQGDYRLQTNAGTIDVTLPQNSSFILTTSTDLGTTSNEFGSNVVGPEPRAPLDLRTNVGTVTVRRSLF